MIYNIVGMVYLLVAYVSKVASTLKKALCYEHQKMLTEKKRTAPTQLNNDCHYSYIIYLKTYIHVHKK